MLVGTRYASATLDSAYDAIVVGSGLGGLSTAALLARAGRRVLVLERHYTAGGFTHSFRRRGFEWDVGVHYVGDVHKPASPLRRIFDTITDGQLQWARMDDVYDRIIVGERQYDFVAGAANFRAELLRSFPRAGAEIDAYLQAIRAASGSVLPHFAPRLLPGPVEPAARSVLSRSADRYFTRTTRSVMRDLVSDPKLAGVLCGQWGDYGLPPGRSSFAMHAVVAQHYLGGGNFPIGGAWRIADTIVPGIEAAGGAVVVNAEVQEVVVHRGRAVGVRLADGQEIRADHVISDAGVHTTFTRLLDPAVASAAGLLGRLETVRPATAHVSLYVGLTGTTAQLGLSQTNLWVYRDYDHDRSVREFLAAPSTDFPLSYISFPSAKDPSWERRYPGRSTIDVISLAPYEWFTGWEGQPWRKRGAEYDDLKDRMSQRLLADLFAQVPAVRDRVAYHELSTPLSTAHFANTPRGEVYGLEHTPQRFAQNWLSPRTPIKGLHLTGQDVLFCGVGSALLSGVLTATSVLGPAAATVVPELFVSAPAWVGGLAGRVPRRRRG